MRDIYAALKEPEIRIRFAWLPDKDQGWYEEKDCGPLISLNVYDWVVETLIHEILHYLNPKWTEKAVRKEEVKLCKRLKSRQKRYIIKLLLQKVVPNVNGE